MADVGLVILRGSRVAIEKKLPNLFKSLLPQVHKRLYVKLDFSCRKDFLELLPIIYHNASIFNHSDIDLRVLLNRRVPLKIDRLFEESNNGVYEAKEQKEKVDVNSPSEKRPYNSVVLGGTFDRLHDGHKVLLSTALLLTNNVLACGVTTGEMNKQKKLWEIIEPVERRCEAIAEFVADVSDSIECRAVPIIDAFGPSIVDPDLECIVVSEETLKGGQAVNAKRAEKGLSTLDVHIINLLAADDQITEETKISSSTKRQQALGTILREPKSLRPKYWAADGRPRYVIGLTGGIASGKTHISKYLTDNGCELIDCDKLGHELYHESETLRLKLTEAFGGEVLDKDGTEINRRKLSSIVFGNKKEMEKLNAIVWPLIAQRVQERISASTHEIVVVDAAVMIEAGWDEFMDQVWTTFVPKEEAVKRICDRDRLTVKQAEARVNSQISNSERIARSNIVFCTLWEYAETKRQVQRALDLIKQKYFKR